MLLPVSNTELLITDNTQKLTRHNCRRILEEHTPLTGTQSRNQIYTRPTTATNTN